MFRLNKHYVNSLSTASFIYRQMSKINKSDPKYKFSNKQSNKYYKSFQKYFPGSFKNEFNFPENHNILIHRMNGALLTTIDSKSYIDMSMGNGSNFLGHSHPEIVKAIAKQLPHGTNASYPTYSAVDLAEKICNISPACDQVRLCDSGSEAIKHCVKLARAYTGKSKILKFEGAHHGANDEDNVPLFQQTISIPPRIYQDNNGLLKSYHNSVVVASFNNFTEVADLVNIHKNDLAGILVEPIHRCFTPRPGFLEYLSIISSDLGIPLIFDEDITGFRISLGGAQETYNVIPDMVAYGKTLGGGLSIGAFGGRKCYMELDAHYSCPSPSPGGNPIGCIAALTTINILSRKGIYEDILYMGDYVRHNMRKILAVYDFNYQIIGYGPLIQIIFSNESLDNYRDQFLTEDIDACREFQSLLLNNGVFVNPMGTTMYLSLAHNKKICDIFLEKFSITVAQLSNKLPGKYD